MNDFGKRDALRERVFAEVLVQPLMVVRSKVDHIVGPKNGRRQRCLFMLFLESIESAPDICRRKLRQACAVSHTDIENF
ncbi:MAG: hypothetical protein Q8Q12_08820 [bacterium]|nr:hypothetical protein [bacterium]